MKKLTILTLTATLAACGGGSPSTQSNTNSDDIEKPDIELLTAMAPPGGAVSSGYDNSKCSNSLETTSNALVVNGSSQNVKSGQALTLRQRPLADPAQMSVLMVIWLC